MSNLGQNLINSIQIFLKMWFLGLAIPNSVFNVDRRRIKIFVRKFTEPYNLRTMMSENLTQNNWSSSPNL